MPTSRPAPITCKVWQQQREGRGQQEEAVELAGPRFDQLAGATAYRYGATAHALARDLPQRRY